MGVPVALVHASPEGEPRDVRVRARGARRAAPSKGGRTQERPLLSNATMASTNPVKFTAKVSASYVVNRPHPLSFSGERFSKSHLYEEHNFNQSGAIS